MPDTTTAPAADQVSAAIELLRSIPGVTDRHTLDDIAEVSTPLGQLANSLHEWLADRKHPADVVQLAVVLDTLATEHGVAITNHPNPPVGLTLVEPSSDGGYWISWPGGSWSPEDRDLAYSEASDSGARVAAMYLLPKGGQA